MRAEPQYNGEYTGVILYAENNIEAFFLSDWFKEISKSLTPDRPCNAVIGIDCEEYKTKTEGE